MDRMDRKRTENNRKRKDKEHKFEMVYKYKIREKSIKSEIENMGKNKELKNYKIRKEILFWCKYVSSFEFASYFTAEWAKQKITSS